MDPLEKVAFSKDEDVEDEDERQNAGNGVLRLHWEPLLTFLLPPSSTPLWATVKGGRAVLTTVQINIISVINIKSTLLCFASGSEPTYFESPVSTDGHFLPSFPFHPRWPFTGTIIYFGEFLGYCFVRANQGWVTNDSSGVAVAWTQQPLLPTLQVTHMARFIFWEFHVNCFCPWLREEQRKKKCRGVKKK